MSKSTSLNGAYIPRHAEASLKTALADTRIVALVGPRQSGKTTLAGRLAASDHRQLISLDNTQSREFAQDDPFGFLQGLSRVVIDEVQRAPNLILELKREVDERPEPGRFLITGSVDLFRSSNSPDSLAGRVETVELFPFSQAELAQLPKPHFVERAFNNDFPRYEATNPTRDLVNRVLGGGYPMALSRSSPARSRSWLRNYVRALTNRDVSTIANINKSYEMNRLISYAAFTSGQLLNYSKLGSQIGVDQHTVERWLDLFEHMFLLRRIPAWHRNDLKRLIKTPKLHFLDSGLLATLQRVSSAEIAANRQLLGPLLESFVYSELVKINSNSDDETNIFHFRVNGGAEVDFVLERPSGSIVGIEVKASASVHPHDFKGLNSLADKTGQRFVCGVLLHAGDQIQRFAPKLYAMPFNVLWKEVSSRTA